MHVVRWCFCFDKTSISAKIDENRYDSRHLKCVHSFFEYTHLMYVTYITYAETSSADWGHIVCTCSSLGFVISELTMIYSSGIWQVYRRQGRFGWSVLDYEWYKQVLIKHDETEMKSHRMRYRATLHVWYLIYLDMTWFAMTFDLYYISLSQNIRRSIRFELTSHVVSWCNLIFLHTFIIALLWISTGHDMIPWYHNIKGQLGVPLTVYPWYLLCSLEIRGDLTHKYPLNRAYIGISHRVTLGSGYIQLW